MIDQIIIDSINSQRAVRNCLSLQETLDLTNQGNIVVDPFSTLLSKNAIIGENNIFYPNVIIEADSSGSIEIKNNNIFYPQTFMTAGKDGHIYVGSENHFEGGVAIKANMQGSQIVFGNNGRYLNGVQFIGICNLESGSQVIGNITVQNCILEKGETYLHRNPDLRGGLLKGFGLARNLVIGKGKVIDGLGKFDIIDIQDQSFFHSKK